MLIWRRDYEKHLAHEHRQGQRNGWSIALAEVANAACVDGVLSRDLYAVIRRLQANNPFGSRNMSNEDRAFAALALMRDRLVVFNGVRVAAFNENLTPSEALESIRAHYEAFDQDHP